MFCTFCNLELGSRFTRCRTMHCIGLSVRMLPFYQLRTSKAREHDVDSYDEECHGILLLECYINTAIKF